MRGRASPPARQRERKMKRYRTPIGELTRAMRKEMKQRIDVLANAEVQLSDVIKELGDDPNADVTERLKNLLGTVQGLQISLAELKS